MDIPSSPLCSSDDSSLDGGSTRQTTPASSPLFLAKADAFSSSQSSPPSVDRLDIDPATRDVFDQLSLSPSPVRNICVIGGGYVGGPTAAMVALHNPGITVEVLDRDPRRVQQWRSPHLPVHEKGLDSIVRVVRDGADVAPLDGSLFAHKPVHRSPNLFFTCDSSASIAQADMIFLAVNTPTKTFGVGAGRATDMTAVDGAVHEIARYIKPGTIIVEKSTVPCGTAQRIRHILSTLRPQLPFEVLSNPEFLSEGCAIENLACPDRILIGSSVTASGHAAAQALASIYTTWIPAERILQINSWSSELAKLVANAMLAQRLSSINSISAICEKTGADVNEVARAVGMDVRIGERFLKSSALGYGGSCFRKDIASLSYLAESLGLDDVAHYWAQVNAMNEAQRGRFARRIIDRFDGCLAGRKIAVLGFAFKKNTADTRESPVVDVIRLLLEKQEQDGPAETEIAIYDPYCLEEDILREIQDVVAVNNNAVKLNVLPDPYLACSQAHAVLVLTDCDQFRTGGGSGGPAHPPPSYDSLAEVLMASAPAPAPATATATATKRAETWSSNGLCYRLAPVESCAEDCACRSGGVRRETAAAERLEWARIAVDLREPKWVFDGRGFLDASELERLGVRVDVVGRRCG